MRLFTGLDIPERERSALTAVLDQLRPLAPLRWSPPANLHVTTKFIGEWPEDRLAELKAALSTVPVNGPIGVSLTGLGWIPNPHTPRMFWAIVKAGPKLAELAAAIEGRLEPLGIAREERPYQAHLTLARIKAPMSLGPVRRAIAQLPGADFGSFEATAFHLYLSSAGHYAKLASFPLVPAPRQQEGE